MQFNSVSSSPRGAWLLLAMLFTAYVLSVIDRFLLSLLVTPIQRDLGIGDAAFGLLHGFAFVLFYVAVGIPIGRIVDRHRRVGLIALGMTGWSAMTIACGLSRQFWQLFAARVGVGVGEAVLSPAGYSLIADSFPHRLALANSIFYLGAVVGGGLALALGGQALAFAESHGVLHLPLLGALAPWQQVFLMFGAPGLLFAALMARLPEPPRREPDAIAPDWPDTTAFLRSCLPWLLPLLCGIGALSIATASVPAWIVALLERRFGMAAPQAGGYSGIIAIACASFGLIAGGLLGDRIGAGRSHVRLYLAATGTAIAGIAAGVIAMAASPVLALSGYGLLLMLSGPSTALAMASLQENTPSRMHGFVAALFMVAVNLIGAGLGPMLVGIVSQATGGIAWGIAAIVLPAGLIGGYCLFIAARALGHLTKLTVNFPA